MTTKDFNKDRAEAWLDKMNKDESRLWLMVGMKQNGSYTCVGDEILTPNGIADRLETLARAIRMKNQNVS